MDIYTDFLVELERRLEALNLPTYFDLKQVPRSTTDFILLEVGEGDLTPTAQSGRQIDNFSQLISIYLSGGRSNAEFVRQQAIALLGRRSVVFHNLMPDDSTGVELYHISIRVNEYLF